MQTKPKSNSVITHAWDQEAGTITIHVVGAGNVVLDLNKVHPDNVTNAAYHGFTQRLSDAAAISRDPATGRPATPEAKLAAIQAIADHYMSGALEWKRTGAGGGRAQAGVTLRAIADVRFGGDLASASASVDRMAEKHGLDRRAVLARLAKSPEVIRRVAEIRAAGAVSAVDLLDEMDDMGEV